MPKKRCSLMNVQISGGRSRCCCTSQSLIRRHSSSTGPSRKACSSALGALIRKSSSFCQGGMPANRSASHHTVPASSAMRSVSPRRGRTLAKAGMMKRETTCRRSVGRPNSAASATSAIRQAANSAGCATPVRRQPASNTPAPASQAKKPRPRNARTRKTSRARMKVSSMFVAAMQQFANGEKPLAVA